MDLVSEDDSIGRLPNPKFRPANCTGNEGEQALVGFAKGREKAAKADPKNSLLVNFLIVISKRKFKACTIHLSVACL
jgi:hypothetical protein